VADTRPPPLRARSARWARRSTATSPPRSAWSSSCAVSSSRWRRARERVAGARARGDTVPPRRRSAAAERQGPAPRQGQERDRLCHDCFEALEAEKPVVSKRVSGKPC